ncbi:MCE family protein [Mycobacterium sp.]|uniref:MCE family protein n=1 Tax=Mycobacterium sp. TaxID=1785 RepID=UPI003C72897D
MPILGQQFHDRLSKRVKIQLAIFTVVAVIAGAVMIFGYIRLPAMFGVGHYTVTVQLPRAAGLYASGNVTYRGTEVGRVTDVRLTDTGVDAVLSLRSDVHIPSDLDAQVHSVSGVGEQYVALLPRSSNGPALKSGDVIPVSRTSVPPDINALLDAANRGLQAIPPDNVKTVIDESYTAIGGLGPEISRFVKGSTQLAIDARTNLDPLVSLIDQAQPVLDSQVDTSGAIHAWAAHVADITHQLQTNDTAVAGLLEQGGPAANEARQLIDRLQSPLPELLANLVSVGRVAFDYRAGIEQFLVILPQVIAGMQSALLADHNTKHPGLTLDFNLNLNVPPVCATGYLPIQQQHVPSGRDGTPDEGMPPREATFNGDLYCRIPQDSPMFVRGARNFPCQTRPGKRAPTAKMCESDEEYVPLNDGFNWKGDPNATLSGQGVPQPRTGTSPAQTPPQAQPPPQAPPTPPIAAPGYNPATGNYGGPDGQSTEGKTWQSMLTPPTGP